LEGDPPKNHKICNLQPIHDIEDDIYATMSHIFLEIKNTLDNAITHLEWSTPIRSLQPIHDIEDSIYATMSNIFLEVGNTLDNAITHLEWSTPIPLPPPPTSHNDNTTWRLQPPDVDFPAEWNNQWSLPPSPTSHNNNTSWKLQLTSP
jgi:hypothetical protein